jgi:outer membrane protein OmpA-like peptidoglycan-associated protein
MTSGSVDNNGCPVIKKKEQEILNTAFNNLEFTTGKSTILASSHAALNDLASLMSKKPEFRLLIEGHTDNVGGSASNYHFGMKRAKNVMNYLISQGIDKQKLSAFSKGETDPIATNETEEGKAQNRRITITVQ